MSTEPEPPPLDVVFTYCGEPIREMTRERLIEVVEELGREMKRRDEAYLARMQRTGASFRRRADELKGKVHG